jgi:lactate 2-monooxygenase
VSIVGRLANKGIQHPDDVRRAKDTAWTASTAPTTAAASRRRAARSRYLPAVDDAADGMPVLFDSGVRGGSGVAKAVALGATAVGVGRPYAYALPSAAPKAWYPNCAPSSPNWTC